MRTSYALVALALTLAPPAFAKSTVPKAPVPLEEYFKIRRVGSRSGILLSFSHDEKLVAYLSDEGGRADVWVQPIAGGTPTQITHVKGFIQGLAFSPATDHLVYTTDIGGDELPHLFLTDGKGTAPRDSCSNGRSRASWRYGPTWNSARRCSAPPSGSTTRRSGLRG